jgi:hypothetical protein
MANEALDGGAIYFENGSGIVSGGTIRAHDAEAGGATIVAKGPSTVHLEGVAFSGNVLPALIAVDGGATVRLLHVSIGGNVTTGLVALQGAAAAVEARATAVDETEPFFVGPGTLQSLVWDCIVSRYASTFQDEPGSAPPGVLFADPGFAAPARGDLHLRAGSPAVDRCFNAGAVPIDLDAELRGVDATDVPNPAGRTWDAGADELVSSPGRFFTVNPCRILDTRLPGQGPAIASGTGRGVPFVGSCGIPATARAVAINATVTDATTSGYVAIFPSGGELPNTSTIHFTAHVARANNAVLGIVPSGGLDAFVVAPGGSIHLVLDVTGYFE